MHVPSEIIFKKRTKFDLLAMLAHQKIIDVEQNSLPTGLYFNIMPPLDIRHYDSN